MTSAAAGVPLVAVVLGGGHVGDAAAVEVARGKNVDGPAHHDVGVAVRIDVPDVEVLAALEPGAVDVVHHRVLHGEHVRRPVGYDSDLDTYRAKGGRIAWIPGTADGPDGVRAVFVNQDSAAVPGTAEAGHGFGTDVSVADVDGDGYADIAVGVPGETSPSGRRGRTPVPGRYGSSRPPSPESPRPVPSPSVAARWAPWPPEHGLDRASTAEQLATECLLTPGRTHSKTG
ncbi:FG-GAP repeat protein [Streptomyces sp. NPDC054834]